MAARLTDKDKIMADEYLIDFDAKNAAIRAGYAVSTARTAAEWIHPEHPTKPKLRELIDKKIAERSRRTGITADRVLMELANVAFANITDFMDPQTGRYHQDAQRSDTAAIASVKIKETQFGTEREIRLADRNRALELLGKHLGMFTENVQITSTTPVIVDDIDAEAAKVGLMAEADKNA